MIRLYEELAQIKQLLQCNKSIWTLKDFCAYAEISLYYGYHLTSNGKISFYRPFGKKIYVDRDEAIAFLKQNKVKSQSQINDAAETNLLNQKH